jgi:chaperonin GroES
VAIYPNIGVIMSVITTYEAVDQAIIDKIASKLNALADRVVLVPLEATNKSIGGIVIPDTASKDASGKAIVAAVGPGRKNDAGAIQALNVTKGQIVYYSKYAGTEINVEGQKALIVKEDDILAIEN